MKIRTTLQYGQLLRYDNLVWRVGMVNDCRARLDPLSTRVTVMVGDEEQVSRSHGKSVNIAPNSMELDEVSEDDLTVEELGRLIRLLEQEDDPAAGGRRAGGRRGGHSTRPHATGAQRRLCMCGCGATTGGYFVPGHDSKFKSIMVRIERGQAELDELAEEVISAYEWCETSAGGFRTLTNYKGEPHDGYDKR